MISALAAMLPGMTGAIGGGVAAGAGAGTAGLFGAGTAAAGAGAMIPGAAQLGGMIPQVPGIDWADWMKAGGSMLGGVSQLGSMIAALQGMGQESGSEKLLRRGFDRKTEDASQLLSQLFYAPFAEGMTPPYSPGNPYSYAPTQAMQNLQAAYLGRTYGMDKGIASAMSSQAMTPLKIGNMPSGPITPAMAQKGLSQTPQAYGQAAIGTQQPGVLRQMDYLSNAGQLAGMNLWRARQLRDLIA